MNQEVKTKWLDALRSGKYEQGQSFLRVDDTFCCLGVLCDIYLKEKNLNWIQVNVDDDPILYSCMRFTEDEVLPEEVMKWVSLDTPDPRITSKNAQVSELNDDSYSFNEIADLIEKEL